MDYTDTRSIIKLLRAYAAKLESGEGCLKGYHLDISGQPLEVTIASDTGRVFWPGDAHHALSIDVLLPAQPPAPHPSNRENPPRPLG